MDHDENNSNNNNNGDSSSLNRIMNESSCDQQTQQTNHVQFSLSPLPLQSSLLQQSSETQWNQFDNISIKFLNMDKLFASHINAVVGCCC